MEKDYLVYIHKRANDGSVFYVGIGKGRRPYVKSGRNKHWENTVKKNGYEVEVLFSEMSQACCKTIEKILIQNLGLENLCNITSGGEGTSGWHPSKGTRQKISKAITDAWVAGKFERVWNKERRAKLSEKTKGALNPMSGKKLTEEHKKKISQSLSGEKHHFYGVKMDDRTREKISKTMTGRKLSDAHRKAISHGQMGRKPSPETIEKRAKKTESKEIYTFFSNCGDEFTGNMRSFAKAFDLDRSGVTKVVNGKLKSIKGWQLK